MTRDFTTLRRLLFEQNISQTELSRKTGISRVYISLGVSGRYIFDAEQRHKIAEVLGEPIEKIFPELQARDD